MNCKELFSFHIHIFLVVLLFGAPDRSIAQSVVAEAKLDATLLSPQERNFLQVLSQDIESYINEFEYTDETYDVQFEMNLQIFVQSVSEAGGEKLYHAQVAITNGSDQRYFDRRWVFVYIPNDPLLHSGVFHTITSFLDFYVNLLLGGEFDLIEPLLGSKYYNSANELASRGKISSHSQGWTARESRLNEISSNWRLREAKGNYSDFLYFLYDEREPEKAMQSFRKIVQLFGDIFDLNSLDKYTIEFINAHLVELCEALYGYRNKNLFEDLISINPTNERTYKEYISKIENE